MKFIAVEQRSAESKGLRFESAWKTHNFFLVPRSWQDEKHLSLFFTELKTYYIPHSIYFRITWTFV